MRTAANNAHIDFVPFQADGQAMADYIKRYGLEADWQGWLTKAGERVAYKIPAKDGRDFQVVWVDPAKREMVLNPTTRAAKVKAAGTKGSASFTLTCEGVGDDSQNTVAGKYLSQDGFREFVADYIKHLVDSAKFWQYDEDVTDPAGGDGHMHIDSVVMDYDNLTIEADFSAKIQGTVTYDYAVNSEFDAGEVLWSVERAIEKSIEHMMPGGDLTMDKNPVSAKRIEKTAEGWLAQARKMTTTAVRYKKMSPGTLYRKIWTGDEVSSVYLGGNWGLGLKGELLIAKNDPDKPSDERWGWYVAESPEDIKYVTEQVEKYKSNGWDIPTKYQGLYDQASRVTASFQMTKIGAKDYPQEAVEQAIRRLEWSDIPKEGKAELPFMQGEALNQIIRSLKLPRPSRVALHGGIGDGHGFYGAEFNMKKEDLTLYIADTGTETFIVAYDQRPKGADATAGKVEFLEVGDTVRFSYPGHTFEGKVGEIVDSDFKRTGVGIETVYRVEGEGIDPEDADSWATADELERVTAQRAKADKETYHGLAIGDTVTVKMECKTYNGKTFKPGDKAVIKAFPPKVRIALPDATHDGLGNFVNAEVVGSDGDRIGENVKNIVKIDGQRAKAATAIKEPWEMTKEEWREQWLAASKAENKALKSMPSSPLQKSYQWGTTERIRLEYGAEAKPLHRRGFPVITHEAVIQKAIAEGKPVPAEVLADYPDLAKPTAAAAAGVPSLRDLIDPSKVRQVLNLEKEADSLPLNEQTDAKKNALDKLPMMFVMMTNKKMPAVIHKTQTTYIKGPDGFGHSWELSWGGEKFPSLQSLMRYMAPFYLSATAKAKPDDEPTDETYAVYGDSEFYRTGDHFYFSNEGRLVELTDDQADQLRAFLAKNTNIFKTEKEKVDALRKILIEDLGLIKRKMIELEMIAVKAKLQESHGDKVADLTRKVLSLTRAVKSAYVGPVAVAIHPIADQIGVKARQVYNETHTDNWVTTAIDPMSREPRTIRAKIDEIERDVRDLKLPIGLANVMANRLKDGLRELKKAIDNL